MQKDFSQYYEAVRYLESLASLSETKKYSNKNRNNPEIFIKRTRYFLNLLGNPDQHLKFIHIAGTAGKGSVANLVQYILFKNGQRTGLFTSPFATTSIEKIKVNDKYIDPLKFAQMVEDAKPLINKAYIECMEGAPSYFEIFFGLALKYFHETKCEWVVLEAGLGGRYDATNVIKKCEIAAITNIGFDHTEILGKTLVKIATDKAGIIKPECVFITTEERPSLLNIFKKIAKENLANKFIAIKGPNHYYEKNEVLVNVIIEEAGVQNNQKNDPPKLPCRFEVVQKKPLIVLDGAHNGLKMQSVVENLARLNYRKLIAIVAIADDKDKDAILEKLIPIVDKAYFTRFLVSQRSSSSPTELYQKSLKLNQKIKSVVTLDPFGALKSAIGEAEPNDLVLVTGSFYLAGELRKKWYPEEKILRDRTSF